MAVITTITVTKRTSHNFRLLPSLLKALMPPPMAVISEN